MKVTIIKNQYFVRDELRNSQETIFHYINVDQLKHIPIGEKAEKIRLELEYDHKDIPKLIEFLRNSEPCFK